MKSTCLICLIASAYSILVAAEDEPFDRGAMSASYWAIWNDEIQRKIDNDIEINRKADARITLGVPTGTLVTVEQISHAFYFGAHIFNYNQLGSTEKNAAYRDLYGTVFNSATVGFYWPDFEPYPGCLRDRPGFEDSEEYWNSQQEPATRVHWRRPATDAPIDWCLSRGVRVHGHPLVWNAGCVPTWLYGQYMPQEEKYRLGFPECPSGLHGKAFSQWHAKVFKPWYRAITNRYSEVQFARLAPVFTDNLCRLQKKRISEIASRYADRVNSWDVVNESCHGYDSVKGVTSGMPVTYGEHGIEAGDYVHAAFQTAADVIPEQALLNINDWRADNKYADEIADLLKAGVRIDAIGMQMHLFDTNIVREIAQTGGVRTKDGWGSTQFWEIGTLQQVEARFARYSRFGKPIHVSEVTISAPGTDCDAQMMQACVAWNLYRAWFAQKQTSGITWWNVVDGCGFAGEPTTSGLFSREMTPKPVFRALKHLICKRWRTNLFVSADAHGVVSFRGYRGRYRLTWKDSDGKESVRYFEVK